jgi:hypothetical protein
METFHEYRKQNEEITRQGILDHWKSLSPAGPIYMQPKPVKHYGSGLDFDTIRISGNQNFIDSILARLKDLLSYEGGQYELKVSIDDAPHKSVAGSMTSYVFYCSLKQKNPLPGPQLK